MLSCGDLVLAGKSAEDLLAADPVLGEIDQSGWPGVSLSRRELAEPHVNRPRSRCAHAGQPAEAAPAGRRRAKSTCHRLNPGGHRRANDALWRIVFTRLGSDPATRAYAERRTAEGKSKAEIIRCLKRYVAREVYLHLRRVG